MACLIDKETLQPGTLYTAYISFGGREGLSSGCGRSFPLQFGEVVARRRRRCPSRRGILPAMSTLRPLEQTPEPDGTEAAIWKGILEPAGSVLSPEAARFLL